MDQLSRRFMIFLVISISAAASFAGDLYISSPFGREYIPVNLAEASIDVTIKDEVIEYTLVMDLINPEQNRMEGWYSTALDRTARISGYALWEKGVKVEGRMLARDEADRIYKKIVQKMTDPGLLTTDNNRFTIRIFPIMPSENKKMEIRFITVPEWENGETAIELPLAFATPDSGEFSMIKRLTCKVNWSSPPAGSGVQLSIAGKTQSGKNGEITCELQDYKASEKVLLKLTRKADQQALLISSSTGVDSSSGYVHLRICSGSALFQATETNKTVLVIDDSGTMRGRNFKELTEAFPEITAAVKPFKVIDLGGNPVVDISKVKPHGPSDMSKAMASLEGLEQINILLISDGDIDAIGNLPSGAAKLFLLKVGDADVSETLSALARNGKAAVFDRGRIQELYQMCNEKRIPEIRITGEGLDDIFPETIRNAEKNRLFHVFLRTRQDEFTIRLCDRAGNQLLEKSLRLDPGRDRRLERLWNTSKVESLLERYYSEGQKDGSVRDEIIKRCIEHGIQSPLTAFLAVPPEIAERYRNIIPGIAAFATPSFNSARKKSRQKACIANIKMLENALEMYDMDTPPGKSAPESQTTVVCIDGYPVPVSDYPLQDGGYVQRMPKCPTSDRNDYLACRDEKNGWALFVFCPMHGTIFEPYDQWSNSTAYLISRLEREMVLQSMRLMFMLFLY